MINAGSIASRVNKMRAGSIGLFEGISSKNANIVRPKAGSIASQKEKKEITTGSIGLFQNANTIKAGSIASQVKIIKVR